MNAPKHSRPNSFGPHAPLPRCSHCGYPHTLVVVHGHAQCSVCGTNVEPCCQGGETCPTPDPDPAP